MIAILYCTYKGGPKMNASINTN